MGELDLFCLADNRKGDPDSMGPLDFYNLLFVGLNRRIKRRFDYAPIKMPSGNCYQEIRKILVSSSGWRCHHTVERRHPGGSGPPGDRVAAGLENSRVYGKSVALGACRLHYGHRYRIRRRVRARLRQDRRSSGAARGRRCRYGSGLGAVKLASTPG